jgi:putative transcriptional regulator
VLAQEPSATPAQAVLLVATEQLRDPLFERSVVLVTRHGRSRPFGVMLNRRAEHGASNERRDKRPAREYFFGGPVSQGQLIFLARHDGQYTPRREILSLADNLLMGFGREELAALKLPESQTRVFSGLAMWAHGQLEAEIARGDWRVLPYDAETVMRRDVDGLWRELSLRSGRISI